MCSAMQGAAHSSPTSHSAPFIPSLKTNGTVSGPNDQEDWAKQKHRVLINFTLKPPNSRVDYSRKKKNFKKILFDLHF